MGVGIDLYRQRIGAFAACVKCRCPSERYGAYCPESVWDEWTDFSARMLICTVALCAAYGYAMVWQAIYASNCVQSVRAAMVGNDVSGHPTMQTTTSDFTFVAYSINLSGILILGGDIELNPGPIERADVDEIMNSLASTLIQRMDEMTKGIKEVRDQVSGIDQKLSKIDSDISEIKRKMEAQETKIEKVVNEQDELRRSVQHLEERLEEREVRDRRDNVLLYGVSEAGSDLHEDCAAVFAKVVSDVLPTPLDAKDLVRAHRVGKRVPGRTRPLIARLLRTSDKFAILRRRSDLREKNIGVSCDLTVKQREELQRARDNGFFAYFKAGVLHTEERRSQQDTGRRVTRSQTTEQSRGAADR